MPATPSADPRRATLAAVLAILGASALMGTTGTAQALGPATTTPLGVSAIRLAVGTLALAAIAAAERAPGWSAWREAPGSLLLAGVTMAAYQVLSFTGLKLAGVALGTIVDIGSVPVFAGLIQLVHDRGRLSWGWAAGTAVTIAGVALVIGPGAGGEGGARAAGVLCMLGAGLVYAVYAHATKAAIARGLHSTRAVALAFGAGGLLLLPLLALEPVAWLATPSGAALALHLGLVTVGGAYWLYGFGLRHLAVPTVATLTMVEPLVAALLGLLVLGERLPPSASAGAVAIGVGLVLVTRAERATDTASPT